MFGVSVFVRACWYRVKYLLVIKLRKQYLLFVHYLILNFKMSFMNIWTSLATHNDERASEVQLPNTPENVNFQKAEPTPTTSILVNNTIPYREEINPSVGSFAKSRPCLAGTQTMQQMARTLEPYAKTQIQVSSKSIGSTTFDLSSTEPNNESSGFCSLSDGNTSIGSAQNHSKTEYLMNKLLDKYSQSRLWESAKHQIGDAAKLSNKQNFYLSAKETFHGASENQDKQLPKTPPTTYKPNQINTPRHCEISNEFAYSTPIIPTNHSGQDLQMLEENMASVTKYVEELTGCGSNPTSRASSCVRVPEIKNNNESQNQISTPMNFEQFQTMHRFNEKNVDTNSIKGVNTNRYCVKTATPLVPSAESNNIPLEDVSSLQIQQLSILNSLLSNLDSSEPTDVLLSWLTNRLLPQSLSHSTSYNNNRIQNQNKESQPTNSCNLNQPSFKNNIPNSKSVFANQLLNLQAALSTLSPSSINLLISAISSSSEQPSTSFPDVRQLLNKLISNQVQSKSSNIAKNGNIGLLRVIGSILSGNCDESLASMLANTSSLTALAANIDSAKSLLRQTGKHDHQNRTNLNFNDNLNFNGNNNNNYGNSNYTMPNHCQNLRASASTLYDRRPTDEIPKMVAFLSNVEGDIDRAATIYRNSANNVAQKLDVAYHWSGKLPMRNYKSMNFSRKVFLGGVPWDSNSDDLVYTFSQFGNVSVLWPQRDGYSTSNSNDMHDRSLSPKGYCYLLFEHEACVCELLARCTRDSITNGDYFKLSSPKFKSKDVQVIPWVISDSQFSLGEQSRFESSNTVFVGALHGMITAEALASIMNDLFDSVVFAALDTDKHKYPIGSGRVVFSSHRSYMKAVTANFLEVRTPKFTKTLQIDPFLGDSPCNHCLSSPGIYFCRAFDCFQYFCPTCWHQWHSLNESLANHKPLRRSLKPNSERI